MNKGFYSLSFFPSQNFFLKKTNFFCKVFLKKKETFFVSKKRWLCLLSKVFFYSFFSIFLFSKINVFLDLFFLIGFSFNKDVFSEKESFSSKSGFSEIGWFSFNRVFFLTKNELLFPIDDFFFKGFFFSQRDFVLCKGVFSVFFQTFFKNRFFLSDFFQRFSQVF